LLLYYVVFIFKYDLRLDLGVMRAEELLKVEESNLNVDRGLKKIAKLLVENENSTVIGMLETVGLNVLVNRLGYSAARDELTLGKTQESTELLGNLLLTVKTVVLCALGGLLSVGIVELSLDLSDNLGERLKFITESGNLGKAFVTVGRSFGRHYTLHMQFVFKRVDIIRGSSIRV
tara:strand:+ start:733 stop:1260 length:528 start_codon:yes stop_codon:yes gene_type:complete